jgi:hypothetical protein
MNVTGLYRHLKMVVSRSIVGNDPRPSCVALEKLSVFHKMPLIRLDLQRATLQTNLRGITGNAEDFLATQNRVYQLETLEDLVQLLDGIIRDRRPSRIKDRKSKLPSDLKDAHRQAIRQIHYDAKLEHREDVKTLTTAYGQAKNSDDSILLGRLARVIREALSEGQPEIAVRLAYYEVRAMESGLKRISKVRKILQELQRQTHIDILQHLPTFEVRQKARTLLLEFGIDPRQLSKASR